MTSAAYQLRPHLVRQLVDRNEAIAMAAGGHGYQGCPPVIAPEL